jgi:hypothetical protein
MTGERFYVGYDEDEDRYEAIGWNLDHEPTASECGLAIEAGPYATEEEAGEAVRHFNHDDE